MGIQDKKKESLFKIVLKHLNGYWNGWDKEHKN